MATYVRTFGTFAIPYPRNLHSISVCDKHSMVQRLHDGIQPDLHKSLVAPLISTFPHHLCAAKFRHRAKASPQVQVQYALRCAYFQYETTPSTWNPRRITARGSRPCSPRLVTKGNHNKSADTCVNKVSSVGSYHWIKQRPNLEALMGSIRRHRNAHQSASERKLRFRLAYPYVKYFQTESNLLVWI